MPASCINGKLLEVCCHWLWRISCGFQKRKRGRNIFNPGHLSIPVLCMSSQILAQLRDGNIHPNFPKFVLAETATLLFPSQESTLSQSLLQDFSKYTTPTQTHNSEATQTYTGCRDSFDPSLLFRFLRQSSSTKWSLSLLKLLIHRFTPAAHCNTPEF